jgi:hypothetical protein
MHDTSTSWLAQIIGHDSFDTTMLYIRGTNKNLRLGGERHALPFNDFLCFYCIKILY